MTGRSRAGTCELELGGAVGCSRAEERPQQPPSRRRECQRPKAGCFGGSDTDLASSLASPEPAFGRRDGALGCPDALAGDLLFLSCA